MVALLIFLLHGTELCAFSQDITELEEQVDGLEGKLDRLLDIVSNGKQ